MTGPPVPRVPPGKKAADIPLPVHEKPPPDGGGFFCCLELCIMDGSCRIGWNKPAIRSRVGAVLGKEE